MVEPGELLKIARLAKQHGFWLLYDDTYSRLVFRPGGRPALQEVKDVADGRLVVVGTVSKTYCMTGWRVGWVMGPRALAEACTALNSHSVQGPATFSQIAAAEALTAPQDGVRAMAAEYERRRDLIHPVLAAIPGVTCPEPEGGFYVFPDVSRCLSKEVPDTLTLAAQAARGEGGGGRPRRRLPRARLPPPLLRDRPRRSPGGRASHRRVPRGARPREADVTSGGFAPGTPVLLYLHTPREKAFGVLVSLQPAGITVRGLDLAAFDDWLRQEARGEKGLGLVTLFYPMSRLERMEKDETVGGLEGIADRFRRETGRSVLEAAGLSTRRKRR